MTKIIDEVIISLFDGLSGGRVALSRTPHVSVLRYYSSEVDKYAIQIADKNYPQDTKYRLGDITKIDFHKLLQEIKRDFGEDVKIKIIGGSPCQGFSMAGKLKGSSTTCGVSVTSLRLYMILKKRGFKFNGQSYLFWEFVRALRTIKPKYFMLENVRVTKKWLPMFNEAMGVEPTRINSSLVSAQNRDRYYWHNFGEIPQPDDKGILLRDILDYSIEDKVSVNTNNRLSLTLKKFVDNLQTPTWLDSYNKAIQYKKSTTLTTRTSASCCTHLFINDIIRKPSPLECERLQTLPDNYTEGVSNSQRYKMIGNGWTIDVVAHIFSCIPNEI